MRTKALTLSLLLLHALPSPVDGGHLRFEQEVVIPDVLQLLLKECYPLQTAHLFQVRWMNGSERKGIHVRHSVLIKQSRNPAASITYTSGTSTWSCRAGLGCGNAPARRASGTCGLRGASGWTSGRCCSWTRGIWQCCRRWTGPHCHCCELHTHTERHCTDL